MANSRVHNAFLLCHCFHCFFVSKLAFEQGFSDLLFALCLYANRACSLFWFVFCSMFCFFLCLFLAELFACLVPVSGRTFFCLLDSLRVQCRVLYPYRDNGFELILL